MFIHIHALIHTRPVRPLSPTSCHSSSAPHPYQYFFYSNLSSFSITSHLMSLYTIIPPPFPGLHHLRSVLGLLMNVLLGFFLISISIFHHTNSNFLTNDYFMTLLEIQYRVQVLGTSPSLNTVLSPKEKHILTSFVTSRTTRM